MNKETSGTIFAITAAIISGFSIPLNKIFVVNLDPLVFTALRSLVIGIAFFVIAYFSRGHVKIKTDAKQLAMIAIIGGAVAFLLFFTGLKLTTAGRGAFLNKTLPLYAVLLAFIFLKEKISKKHFYSLLIMFLGTVAIFFSEIIPTQLWLNPSLGDFLVVIATILWAFEAVIARKAMVKGENNFFVSFVRMFFGGVILFAFAILIGKYDIILSLSTQQLVNIVISTVILFGYVFFWYWSLKLINVSKASTLLLISPVISLLIGMIVLREPAPLIQIAGSALILIGAYIVSNVKSEFQNI
jgi:drug/metabolite transporter (DMT)-like permease